MMAGILINFLVVCLAAASAGVLWLAATETIVLCFLFSMFGVYGARADAVGLIGLIAFIISYGSLSAGEQPFIYTALYFAAGGAWYALFSILTNTIQPYKPAAQLLGEYLIEIGHYLEQRSEFYKKDADNISILQQLVPYQVNIQQQQGSLRELMFKTRLFVKQPTNKGRRLMMMFLESTDLLERIMTAQQDYKKLHTEFDNSDILEIFQVNLHALANALLYTGLAVQNDKYYSTAETLDAALQKSSKAFFELRKQKLTAKNITSFIRLRHVLYSIEDVSERIKRIQQFTHGKAKVSRTVKKEDVAPFTTTQDFNIQLLLSNLSLKSFQFRHALRLTIAMAAGFIISLLFPLGHSYWILLAIATILKPAYSITRKRNIERVTGTLLGTGLAFTTLHFSGNNTATFIIMLVAMLVAYTFLRVNNLVSTASITLYVVLSFHFLYPAGIGTVLKDRIVDTVVGALIALPASYFILPSWEHGKLRQLLTAAVQANSKYFTAVTAFFHSKSYQATLEYKLSRKAAFVALANVSDALQRMLSEPKSKQEHLAEYHQLVTASHMLTSYIASLAYYAERYDKRYDVNDLKPMMQYIARQFVLLKEVAEQPGTMVQKSDPFPVNKKLKELLAQRRSEIDIAVPSDVSVIAKTVSMMKTIADQMKLVNAAVEDMMKVLRAI
jgi:uncharacterized membrane protein YccC